MDFTLQEKDLRPNLDLYQWIFADGVIVPSTADKFKSFVASHPQLVGGATVILNSPGGSVTEGMRLGDIIRDLHFRTAVGVIGAEPLKALPGQCMSACIFPYLGGDYRYLDDGNAIGIHRFKFDKDFGGEMTAEISQQLSGLIVDYIRRSRADPSLFALMTQTSPDSIRIVPMEDLVKLKVVTGDIYSENWAYEVRGDISYLKADQVTWRGQNKLLFVCPPDKPPVLMTLSELPDRDSIIASARMIMLIIDGRGIPLSLETVVETPMASGDTYLRWTVALTPQLAEALKLADKIGSGISPGPVEMFAGVAGIKVGDGREKLTTFLDNCRESKARQESAEEPLPKVVPTDIARKAALAVIKRMKVSGMLGVGESIRACYARVAQLKTENSAQYCFILDYIASDFDAAVSTSMKFPQNEFHTKAAVNRRSAEALAAMGQGKASIAKTLAKWQSMGDSLAQDGSIYEVLNE